MNIATVNTCPEMLEHLGQMRQRNQPGGRFHVNNRDS